MPELYIHHPETGATIAVEVGPLGLSESYTRAGWVEVDAPVEDDLTDEPAEPVTPEPDDEPDEPIKEF